jgi:hypothetical protein
MPASSLPVKAAETVAVESKEERARRRIALFRITARKLGCVILTRTMERRHQLGLDSYDRFFPNQDTMPKGGLGNLIALPLQLAPRKSGNSVFIDSDFHPYHDQWQFRRFEEFRLTPRRRSLRKLSAKAT